MLSHLRSCERYDEPETLPSSICLICPTSADGGHPDKFYVGTFERSSRFETHLDPTGIALILERPGADDGHKSIHMHINFGLFADILRELALSVSRIPKDDVMHRDQLTKAVAELHTALVKA